MMQFKIINHQSIMIPINLAFQPSPQMHALDNETDELESASGSAPCTSKTESVDPPLFRRGFDLVLICSISTTG
jgi:hypothetical protein